MYQLRRLTRLFALAFIISAAVSVSVAERRERLIEGWRPVHYDVTIAFDSKLSRLTSAKTDVTVLVLKEDLDSIDLDFGEMAVNSVTLDRKPAKYVRDDGKLTVELDRPRKLNDRLTISVTYHGVPKDGLIFKPDNDGTPAATGDNWPNRVHHWIPTFDHPSAKATVKFTVTAPRRYIVVANGKFQGARSAARMMRTWVWNETVPVSPYCMIVAVGNFAKLEPIQNSVTPLSYYVPQSDRGVAMQGFVTTSPSLKYFNEIVGPYPYEKLAMIVGATRFGGMENSSAIIFGSGLFKDFATKQPRSRVYGIPSGVRNVVAHEVAHQWFGDSVTEATWADLWLSEGFANYFEGLFIERYEGKLAFRAYMKEIGDKYFKYEKTRNAPIHDKDTEDLNALLNSNNYDKGAWVLHMLRGLTGDKAFFQAIRNYYASHRDSTATSEDLRRAMEKTSGLDLKTFFDQWIYGSGHPSYELEWQWSPGAGSDRAGVVEIRIRQIQENVNPFVTPIVVEIGTSDGKKRILITPNGRDVSTQIPVTHPPTSVIIDPDEVLLKEVIIKPKVVTSAVGCLLCGPTICPFA